MSAVVQIHHSVTMFSHSLLTYNPLINQDWDNVLYLQITQYYIVACQAHPALVKQVRYLYHFHFLVARQPVYMYQVTATFTQTKGLTDRVSSRLRGLAVYWRPRPSGMRQYIIFYPTIICNRSFYSSRTLEQGWFKIFLYHISYIPAIIITHVTCSQ